MHTRILNFQSIYNNFQGLILIFVVLLSSCSSDNKFERDISNIDVEIKINRFDKALMGLDHDDYEKSLKKLQNTYPDFYQLYIENILGIGKVADEFYQPEFQGFLQFEGTKSLYKDCITAYPDLSEIEADLSTSFKYYSYYFPEAEIPEVYSYFSEYIFANVTADNILGIGLDMYLGKDHQYYPSLNIPLYKFRKFREDYIISNSMKAFAYSLYDEASYTDKDLLSQMVYHGKIMYFMDCVLPHTHDSIKIGYTPRQLKWCELSEGSVWAYLIDQNLLYEKDQMKFQKLLKDGPYTTGLPNDSAPMLGIWIGWQIVRAYMEKFSHLALPNLMHDADMTGRTILDKSKYKPKK